MQRLVIVMALSVMTSLGWAAPTAVATFEPAGSGARALTYDQTLVPPGAQAVVTVVSTPLNSISTLLVTGLRPDRTYGAHVHTQPCGSDPMAAGGHLQHVSDPVQPSTDPAYANPRNEIWLDLTTNSAGTGMALSTVSWSVIPGSAGSVVLHEHATHTEPGMAGVAGERVGCITLEE